MKIPKVINICGKPTSVVLHKGGGGAFSCNDRIIKVGTRDKGDIQEILLHEILESILAENNMRFCKNVGEPDNGDYRFVFNHDEFERFCKDVAAALKGIKF